MMIHKIIRSIDYIFGLKRLNTQLNEPDNQNSIKVPKVANPTKESFYKSLGTSVINSSISPQSLDEHTFPS